MSKKNYLGKYYIILITLVTLLLYILNVNLVVHLIRNSYSFKLITVFGAISDVYGDIDKSIIDKVLNGKAETYQKGLSILEQQGYKLSGISIIRNSINKEIILISIFILVILILLIFSLIAMFKNHLLFLNHLEYSLDKFDEPNSCYISSNRYIKNVSEKLYKLSLNSKHNIRLLQKEKEKIYDFMQDLSHQMKTPLAVAHLYIEKMLYENKNLNSDKLKLSLIQMEKMSVLINSYLKISMLESINVKIKLCKVNIFSFIEDVVEDLRPLSDENNTEIIIYGHRQDYFHFDDFWMKEALVNLLKNSIEHSPRGLEIYINFQKDNHNLVIQIKDQGVGIKEESIPFLFERFTSSSRQKDGSNGLGLSIAEHVVKRHYGKVIIKNNLDRGVTFEVTIPILKEKEVYNPYYDVR